MEKINQNGNRLAEAGILGASIVKCDDQKCDGCVNEQFDCKKLICSGGHICVWGGNNKTDL